MGKDILGIHHVTAIAGDPQQNIDFYAGVLGLRLVKLTINFDDPGSYHLYYGDGIGHPGTILTFFPWPGAVQGRQGNGQISVTSFLVLPGTLPYWMERFQKHGVTFEQPVTRFDEQVLEFSDPDGLPLELVGHTAAAQQQPWQNGPIPAQYAIRGFHGVTLSEEGYERTASLLTDTLGFRLVRQAGNRFRYEIGSEGPGRVVDILCQPDGVHGLNAVGTVHHVAWRTPDDNEQQSWRRTIAKAGLNVTPVIDRTYFHSIYFREPGGVLFEIATDPPGFTVDESPEELGTHLMLPSWLEPSRTRIEKSLPRIRLPKT